MTSDLSVSGVVIELTPPMGLCGNSKGAVDVPTAPRV
jgi:hypothetical protein